MLNSDRFTKLITIFNEGFILHSNIHKCGWKFIPLEWIDMTKLSQLAVSRIICHTEDQYLALVFHRINYSLMIQPFPGQVSSHQFQTAIHLDLSTACFKCISLLYCLKIMYCMKNITESKYSFTQGWVLFLNSFIYFSPVSVYVKMDFHVKSDAYGLKKRPVLLIACVRVCVCVWNEWALLYIQRFVSYISPSCI